MSIQHDEFSSARLIAPQPQTPQEEAIERALRPKTLIDYVGQAKIREQLDIFIRAARQRNEPLDHVLLFGPPGLGKTTLAHILAQVMGVNLRQTSGPVLERAATWRHYSPILSDTTFFLSTRFTVSPQWLRKFFILHWRTIKSTS